MAVNKHTASRNLPAVLQRITDERHRPIGKQFPVVLIGNLSRPDDQAGGIYFTAVEQQVA
ncbi:hypothetical protein D3C80_2111890 [compost metagenome]